ncbi:MAG: hypothetical protein EPN26_14325 [Rhodospirillales bacterium]|nr:MAG: hypothetical protein EPN26_14325 [Rhodospirillales bacterium]
MKTRRLLFAVLSCFSFLLVSLQAIGADAIGAVERVGVYAYGTVPQKSRSAIYGQDRVFLGERVETVQGGSLKIRFLDETELFMGSKSDFVIDVYVYDPAAANEAVLMKMTVGTFRYVSGKITKHAVKIDTPHAVVGIRGTDFTITIDESGKTFFSVAVGEIEVSPKDGSASAVVGKDGPVSVSPGGGGVMPAPPSSVPSDPGVADAGPGSGGGPGGGDGGGDGGGGGSSCFVAGTEVLMADGSVKPIEAVLVGEKLAGADGAVNEVQDYERPLLAGRKLYALNGGASFVTAEHPFMTKQGWKSVDPKATAKENPNMKVGALQVGDVLVTKEGVITITSLVAAEADPSIQVYNFKLSGSKTYFVREKGKGAFLLVHNCG